MKTFALYALTVLLVIVVRVYTDDPDITEEETISYEQAAYEFLVSEFPDIYGEFEGGDDLTINEEVVLEIIPRQ